jgi:hypothetical protein
VKELLFDRSEDNKLSNRHLQYLPQEILNQWDWSVIQVSIVFAEVGIPLMSSANR